MGLEHAHVRALLKSPCVLSLWSPCDLHVISQVPKLVVVGRGDDADGAAEDMSAHLTQGAFLYALVSVPYTSSTKQTIDATAAIVRNLQAATLCACQVRVKQTIDASVTVKFALVSWVGEEATPTPQPKLPRPNLTLTLTLTLARYLNPTPDQARVSKP